MAKRFTCSTGTFDIDEVINGQTSLQYYDPLAQIAARPDLREGTVMCYNETGVEGLFAQLQALYKSDTRRVRTNPYYWTEKCEADTIVTTVLRNATPGLAGQNITVDIDMSSHARGGKASFPMAGRRAYIKELKNQAVNIISVNRAVNGKHTMVIQPVNNQIINLSRLPYYTFLVVPLRMYKKGTLDCIETEGFTMEQPLMRKGWVQKYEKAYEIHDDELTHYAYDREFKMGEGINPRTGKIMEYWSLDHITDKLIVDYLDTRTIEGLFGVRDDVKGEGFDGVITVAEAQGMFSNYYDPADGVSLKQKLFNMMKSMRKVNGCHDYILAHDFAFGLDWSEQIAALVKATIGTHQYALFGAGGEGVRNFNWYEFKDFNAYNYHFRTYEVKAFDEQRYGAILENFAFIMPACTFKDTLGNDVPPVTTVVLGGGAEENPVKHIWVDDTRERGCRTVKAFIQDTFGQEIHCGTKMGVWRKQVC